jgi:hypothetical protein
MDSDSSLKAELKNQLSDFVRLTIKPVLHIANLTIVYWISLKASDWVLASIVSSQAQLASQNEFATQFLLGLRLFSLVGIGVGYVFHTIIRLYREGKELIKMLYSEFQSDRTQVSHSKKTPTTKSDDIHVSQPNEAPTSKSDNTLASKLQQASTSKSEEEGQ